VTTAPAAFLAHGSPMSALGGDDHARALRDFGEAHRAAEAILIVSAHWQKPMPLAITSWETAPLIYDFTGFPDELRRIEYPAHGDAALAARIDLHLHAAGLPSMLDPGRGLDHGAWVPLRLAWPDADRPVIALSLPIAAPRALFKIGEALQPLRRDGVLIAGSGGIVHNLRRADIRNKDAAPPPWAVEFDRWVAERIDAADYGALFEYRSRGPNAALAVPTSEHLDPLFIVLGAAFEEERPRSIYAGFHYGAISMRSFSF
jgi:4,5-DOPA dioxygenase extradiol